ncbi:MAG: lamin tail domain-containing protein [Ruminococcus sp.]|nr:lamin tail domain-containing protein [Ruminococcus sp.]
MIKKFAFSDILIFILLCGLFSLYSVGFKAYSASEKVVINEICGENTFYKAPDGNIYAWLELYNGTSADVNISGWGISDDTENPYKYSLPADTILPKGERKIIFCNTAETTDFETARLDFSKNQNTALLTDRFGNEVDRVVFGKTETDMTYGQYPEDSGNYSVSEPTPLEKNQSPDVKKEIKEKPVFSHESGFYDKDFMLKIEVPEGMEVYYTMDGSRPTKNSARYNAQLRITDPSEKPNLWSARTDISSYGAVAPKKAVDKVCVIRAVAVDKVGRVGEPVTATYFLGKTNDGYYKNMKVISIVTDPENLFDYDTGIYVKGKYYDMYFSSKIEAWNRKANYTQKGREWEREAFFEVFDSGKHILSQNVGIRIKGATSRSTPQKSFNIYAREEYGNKKLDYDFFDGRAVSEADGKIIDSFDSLVIRNAGNDTAYSYLRDNMNQNLVRDRKITSKAMAE